MRLTPRLRGFLRPLGRLAETSRVRVYAVGGCVRDSLLGVVTRDLDLAVEGDPKGLARAVARRWGASLKAFGRFGTVRLELSGGARMDLARTRAETYPRPGALPVVRPAALTADLGRRDFTVNAMARPVTPQGIGDLIDPFGGRADLKGKRLRVLHPLSFRDDPTRLFRAARYAGRFSLRPEPKTAALSREAVLRGLAGLLSRERVRQELIRLLEERDPGPAMRLLKRWGLWPAFHPGFRFPPKARAGADAHARLGLCALGMKEGAELIRSLPLEREVSRALLIALKLARLRSSPRSPLPELARRVLESGLPRLPASALKPLMVGGADLKALGLKPGRVFSERLDRAARAQWRGRFRTKSQARRWLKAQSAPRRATK